jgi:hypothetical protein
MINAGLTAEQATKDAREGNMAMQGVRGSNVPGFRFG